MNKSPLSPHLSSSLSVPPLTSSDQSYHPTANQGANVLTSLNKAQIAAVTAPDASVLVIAGAGSGKTRVLTHRVAWLLKEKAVPLDQIMAVTFTNKAASEMRHRLEDMLNVDLRRMWLGTFHGLAHRFLRIHFQEAGLDQSFQIIDSDDQQRLIKRIHKDFNLDEEQWPSKQSQAFINKHKERCSRSHHVAPNGSLDVTLLKIYQAYEDACTRANLVDFAELLLKMYEVLQARADVLDVYKRRFTNILIDEFQDTNSIQYLLIRALAFGSANLMVVGDDDQSIYGWRGANVENIQYLMNDFPSTKIIRLEQNYRSTSKILDAANALISHNTKNKRFDKKLWTEGNEGAPIILYTAANEAQEAQYVSDKIKIEQNGGECKNLGEIAILYRSNAQSRVFEEQFIREQIPYRIYGGLRFLERAEIKDALAYLRVVLNADDDAALERILNVPTRGIGETTLLQLRTYAKQEQCSLFAAIQAMLPKRPFSKRAGASLESFFALIQELRGCIRLMDLGDFVAYVLKVTGLLDYFAKDKNERNSMRVENLEELVSAVRQFSIDGTMDLSVGDQSEQFGAYNDAGYDGNNIRDGDSSENSMEEDILEGSRSTVLLSTFLAHAALESGDMEHKKLAAEDCVQLMTLHAAKGLEFHTVFLCGMEDGLFPHAMSMQTPADLEEERRLCYVGITRAKSKLYCTRALSRQIYGATMHRMPSRFLREIPEELTNVESAEGMLSKGEIFGVSYGDRSGVYGRYAAKTAAHANVSTNTSGHYSSERVGKNNSTSSFVATGRKKTMTKAQSLYTHLCLGQGTKKTNIGDSTQQDNIDHGGFAIGQMVMHQKFGEGVIIGFEGKDKHLLVQVKFTRVGTKWLSPTYAKLEKV